MAPEDRDQANAALLLDENITQRLADSMKHPSVAHALLENSAFRHAIEQFVQNEINDALSQMAKRVQPKYHYGASSKQYY